jgi:hypothetical protein
VKANLAGIDSGELNKKHGSKKRWWTPEEDDQLKKVVEIYGVKN